MARACRIIDVSTASIPAAQKAADAYALEAALYAVAYETARLVRSDMWPLVAMRLDAAQEVGTRTSDLHIRQPLGKLIMRRHPLAVRGSTAQNLVEELLYAAAKRMPGVTVRKSCPQVSFTAAASSGEHTTPSSPASRAFCA